MRNPAFKAHGMCREAFIWVLKNSFAEYHITFLGTFISQYFKMRALSLKPKDVYTYLNFFQVAIAKANIFPTSGVPRPVTASQPATAGQLAFGTIC